MSHFSKIFESAPIKVQNKNGFDLSHLNCGTSKTGQLVPVMCKLLPPNSDFTLGVSMNVNLPPLSVSFYGKVDAIVEGFVIPLSILYGGWKQFIMNQEPTAFPATQNLVVSAGGYAIPYFDYSYVSGNNIASFTTLLGTNDNILEYLGALPAAAVGSTGNEYKISLLPLLAYHLCCDVYYRNKQITKTWFAVNPNVGLYGAVDLNGNDIAPYQFNKKNVSLIWHSFYTPTSVGSDVANTIDSSSALFSLTSHLTFPDGTSIFSTRQRNYSRDYFTTCTPTMNRGSNSALSFDIDTANEKGEFTIGALRAANSLAKFLETNALSADYAEQMKNRWGTHPIDADFDEPYYLGRVVLPVYQKSVAQSSAAYSTELDVTGANSVNPFVSSGVMGAKGANGGFSGEGSITEKYHNSTWSYVMCLFSLVPHAAYGYGLNRELQMLEIGDFPAPEMQSVGNEAIKASEVYFNPGFVGDVDFGYIPRFSRFKYIDDSIHGELRPGKTLESFVLQRRLSYNNSADVAINTNFLQIPQNALDSVFAVSTESMNLSCWYEIYFEFKVAMPLADFCIPTLGDIADTHTQHTPISGSRL